METWTVILLVAMATLQLSSAQNTTGSMFGNLPQGNYTDDDGMTISKGSLDHLFDMARGFVNVVFRPFDELSEIITEMLEADDVLTYLQENWQKVASFEAGYMTCLVFGLLFILLVPIVGSCMCCCRCCCGNCGGKLEQSEKRNKSCWRQCLCVSMLILTIFMAIPTVFVFLTNEWVTQVIDNGPVKTVAILNDMNVYLNLVPTQITYMTDQYSTVDDNVRPIVVDFGESIGIPLQADIEEMAAPSLAAMNKSIAVVDEVNEASNNVEVSLSVLQTGMTSLNKSLKSLQENITKTVDGCTTSECIGVRISAQNLVLGFDPNEFDSLRTDLQSVQDEINDFDLHDMYANVTKEIDNIPDKTRDETQAASDSAVQALDDASKTISDLSSEIPTDQFDDITQQINNLQTQITDTIQSYDDNFDKYRYIAGLVLGSILAFIVACYLLGMLLGLCGQDRKLSPVDRTGASNCGGIMLMVGVGLSFIFSWLLMILVLVTFTIGGHGERYGCQGLEGPDYEALTLIEDQAGLDLTGTLGLPDGVELTVVDIVNSCENDKSAYEAFKLVYIFNITSYMQNVTSFTDDVKDNVDQAVADINLDTIDVYSEQDQKDLLGLKDTGLDGINFTDYEEKLGPGVTQVNLTDYAEYLRNASNFITDATIATNLRINADEVDAVQANQVVPLQDDYDTLQASIAILLNDANSINDTIDELDASLEALNTSIKTDGKRNIQEIAESTTDQVVNNITAYTDWIGNQLTTTLGACRPVYDTYVGVIGVFCDYLIDTLNGLWFSLGWCVFFLIPSAIVAMKLMKFFRRMDVSDEFEEATGTGVTMDLGVFFHGMTSK